MSGNRIRLLSVLLALFTLAMLWFVIQKPFDNSTVEEATKDQQEQDDFTVIPPKKEVNKGKDKEISKGEDGGMTTESLSHLTLNGEPFHVSDYGESTIVVSFFSSTCPYCTQQTEVFESHRDDLDYEVFYVPFYEEYEIGRDHLDSLDLGVDHDRILEDPNYQFADTFKLQATPTNLFANQDHNTIKGLVGLTSGEVHGQTDEEFLEYLFNLISKEE